MAHSQRKSTASKDAGKKGQGRMSSSQGPFAGKLVVVGVCGGIAAYKSIPLIEELRRKGANTHVIATTHALSLINEKDLEKASKNPVRSSLFEKGIEYSAYLKSNRPIPHMSLADSADLFLICPATANVMAKIAHGICDDLLTTSICATSAPVIICPAMNVKMWQNPLVQKNVKILREVGGIIIGPEYGELACGYKGMGRLSQNAPILSAAQDALVRKESLKGVRVLVSAGGTQEAVDEVRVITNLSSGKMGVRIAEQAKRRGAEVMLVRTNGAVEPMIAMEKREVRSAKDLAAAMREQARKSDIIIHTAAVSDFTLPKKRGKIKSGSVLHLELEPTAKILERLKEWSGKKAMIVGFKAEYSVDKKELIARARRLLDAAKADLIVANDIAKKGAGFESDENEVHIVSKEKVVHLPLQKKSEIAKRLLDEIERMRK